MALKINWSTRADIKLDQLIIYLQSEWGESVVQAFMRKLYDFLEILSEFPEIGSMQYPEKQIRGFALTKQVSIFYRMDEDQIVLLDFFDNRSDPKKKDAL
jgi:plasmid stabilization system protein ParE